MSSNPAIETVAVVGGGIVACSAAAALKRRIPSLSVTLVQAPVLPAALADRIISTLPSIHGFHHDLGLTDEDAIRRAGSGQRLGTLFEGWVEGLPGYVHAYGPYGHAVAGVPFHQLWLRERSRLGPRAFDRYSPAAESARRGFMPSPASGASETGLQLNLQRYTTMMRAFALHLGATELPAAFSEVQQQAGAERIESIVLTDGSAVTADLYVDCTGPEALLRSALTSDFIDWGRWLPCDRVIVGEGPPAPEAILMDRVTAGPTGWRWLASSPHQSSRGLAYSSAHAREEDLGEELRSVGGGAEQCPIRQGRRGRFWVGNCVALGDAAVAVEPLEWTNLHLAHSQIDRMVAMMPGPECAALELQEFNRQCAAEADRVRDFICLHYLLAQRPEPFWKDAASVPAPDSLAHTMAHFAQRGRLPFYEEETFSRDSWLALLFGQGFEPRRADPLADQVTSTQAEAALRAMRDSLERSFPFGSGSTLAELNPRGAR